MKNELFIDAENIQFDEIGPELIVKVYDPKLGYHGVVVIDNRNLGVAKGGFRMTPHVTAYEVSRLARGMTLKNALAGLPFGGGKGGIRYDHRTVTPKQKQLIVEDFARKLKGLIPEFYISGPDMNIAEREMEQFARANGSWDACTGKPASYCTRSTGSTSSPQAGSGQAGKKKRCGLPHELGSTGYGVALSTIAAAEYFKLDIKGMSVAIAGYGNVGQFAHKFLQEAGAKVVAVSDSQGTLFNEKGLDWRPLWQKKTKRGGTVTSSKAGKVLAGDEIYELDVDVLIPAAGSDVIHDKNVSKVKASIIVEGANIPMKPHHEERLHKRDVLVIPDIIANAGGVISSYAELKGYDEAKMFKLIKQKIVPNVKEILRVMEESKMLPREAALAIARERVLRGS
ncbi:MAG: Glu/Leu/Phe/Val dehydrogenase [Candidatus Harrisonbacteria bacterium CG10_big_fil_rev_8_21_14_0_10_49_15]|uniref:Glutamate dehydrogenase n=1 Tax=Candidatus Harrisonbacteria bacterium CG10_big_fil_rev_8_21_14_0_10_49_15 TaxID=1974587 RepID=A0A2H0UK03_9BACT|nr:MAG: Glu/Leu/Phe/Val dehydrogenase [Candidatus Harrisonbacteria bacterium CG10_big_fil_rev_8_21_14_0_10_49_15]